MAIQIRSRRPSIACLVAGALVVSAAACGGSPTQTASGTSGQGTTAAEEVYAEFADLTGEERKDALIKAAQEEGKLVLASLAPQDAVIEAFEKSYGIDVETTSPESSEALRARLLEQHRAGRVEADVIETYGIDLQLALAPEGLLSPYQSDVLADVPDENKHDVWTTTNSYAFYVGHNTDKVPDGEAPASFEDLADPKWDGRVAMDGSMADWYYTLYTYFAKQGMSDDEFSEMFKAIADGSRPTNDHSTTTALLASGEFDVVAAQAQILLKRNVEKGAPLSASPYVAPTVLLPNGAGLARQAEHPAAALLYMDYILTEGQQYLLESILVPANPAALPADAEDISAGQKLVSLPLDGLTSEEFNRWTEAYDNLLHGEEKVLP
jgi:iron(III) transport system substrate-binding protein